MNGYRDFADRIGHAFVVRHSGGEAAAVLGECRPHTGDEHAPSSFAITFRVAADLPVEQGTYEISADGFGPESIFLVPTGAVADDPRFATVFEAVFTTSGTSPGGS